MKVDDFSAFYEAVHGHPPFPWQMRLARAACEADWPRVLSLPTASGKTSAIDVAVFSLAFQADRPTGERTARMRTVFVVDRRVVVDEAFEHARRLEAKLDAPGDDPTLVAVAERLRSLSSGDRPLAVALLRGGIHRDERWAHSPAQPTIVVSTVDQVGSRLFFRGYGLPARSRPIHAGLLGMDTRILLDEAHLSAAFEDSVEFAAAWQNGAPKAALLPPPMTITTMTATPRGDEAPLRLDHDDLATPALSRRLQASKPAAFRLSADLVAEAAEAALAWAKEGHVVGVVVNRVATAREVFARVHAARPDQVVLLTGRMRPIDRDAVLSQGLLERVGARRNRERTGPFVVVATQTIEVGANLDFDRLVTELAPLDALRQRFGRLNRMGNHDAPTPAVVLARKEDVTGRDAGKDPLYGDRPRAVWEWGAQAAGAPKPPFTLDMGVLSLDARLEGDTSHQLSSQAPRPPVMLPAHLDAWAQTSPAPVPDPPVAPYLHGPDALEPADLLVVWRADLPQYDPDHPEAWAEVVAALPPKVMEAVSLPRAEVRRWLAREAPTALHDLESRPPSEGRSGEPVDRPVLIWRGPEDSLVSHSFSPGDTLVVPSAYGGIHPGSKNWDPGSEAPVDDVAEKAAAQANLRVRRLSPAFLPDLTDEGARKDLEARLEELRDDERIRPTREILAEMGAFFGVPKTAHFVRYADDRWLARLADDAEFGDDGEESANTAVEVELVEHSGHVREHAERFVARLGRAHPLARIVVQAAWLHDVGKADPRMQSWLAEGAPDPDRKLAKSAIPWNDRRRNVAAREGSGYPRGARHELQSVAMLLATPDALADCPDADLLLHLVGTHHGHGRGLPPVVTDESPVEVEHVHDGLLLKASSDHRLHLLDSGWAERFWRLHEAYGPWGLAWAEAVLRLADHRASEEEARSSTPSPTGGAK